MHVHVVRIFGPGTRLRRRRHFYRLMWLSSNRTFEKLQSAIFPAMPLLKVKFLTNVKLRSTQKSKDDEEAKKARARQQNRARVQAYRERIKQDEVKWNHFKTEKQVEMRRYRRHASEEQKQRSRETAKLRMQKYRERLKLKRQEATKPPKKMTRAETQKKEHQREDWRMKQRIYRSKLTAQKQRRIREKDRKRKQDERKKFKKTTHNDAQEDVATGNCSSFTEGTKRKIASRARKHLPSSPRKFAVVVSHLVSNSSPECQDAIKSRWRNKHKASKQHKDKTIKCLTNVYKSLKRSTEERMCKKTMTVKLAQEVKKKYGVTSSTISKTLGIRPAYWSNCAAKTEVPPADLHKRKQRSDMTTQELTSAVHQFYLRDDVSVQLPNKRDVSKKTLLAKHVLNRSIDATYRLWTEENSCSKLSFSKFAAMRPKHVVTRSKRVREQCLCEYCENVQLLVDQINVSANRYCPDVRLKDVYEASSVSLCRKKEGQRYNDLKCLERKCTECGVKLISARLDPLLQKVPNDVPVEWARWETVKESSVTRKSRVVKSGSLRDLISQLQVEIKSISHHLFTADWQKRQFCLIRKSLPIDAVLLVMDFSQNFGCSFQREVQSAHWSQEQVTLHPVVAYYRCPDDNETIKEAIHVISNDKVHDSHAVATFVQKVSQHIKDVRKVDFQQCIQFTDGCGRQYKSATPFSDISHALEDLGCRVDRNFFGSRHGKSDSDGEGGVVKSAVTKAVTSEEVVITDARSFYDYCHGHLSKGSSDTSDQCRHFRRSFVYVDKGDINRNRPSRQVKTVNGTMKLHSIRTVSAGIIVTRKLSCYCSGCTTKKECVHKDYVDSWQQVTLQAEENISELKQKPDEDLHEDLDRQHHTPEDGSSDQLTPDIRAGNFVVVAVSGKRRKVAYIARVVDIDDKEVQVHYLQKSGTGSQYLLSTQESEGWHPWTEVLCKLEQPSIQGTGSRVHLTFKKSDLDRYLVKCAEL